MGFLGLKRWHWGALLLIGVWAGMGAESTAEFYGSILGAVLLGLLLSYLKRGIQSRLGDSTESETPT